jgi:endonuclease YncB( thermonuclease family)
MPRRRTAALLSVAASAALAGGLLVAPASQAATSTVTWTTAKVLRWSDGDTVITSKGTVRLIGVDTPETGRCGSAKATELARRLAPVGTYVRLGNPSSVRDRDAYGRHLRFVDRAGVDIANRQIMAGSRARYDGKDGYQWHPRQAKYRGSDARYANYACGTATTTSAWAVRANTPVSASNPDIDCSQIPAAYKPIRITGPDYHRLDSDGDGWGCDS